jgi:hypothetical protein
MFRAKGYVDGVASTAVLVYPYNLLCFPKDARCSEVAVEFHMMTVHLESCTSFPISR